MKRRVFDDCEATETMIASPVPWPGGTVHVMRVSFHESTEHEPLPKDTEPPAAAEPNEVPDKVSAVLPIVSHVEGAKETNVGGEYEKRIEFEI